MRAILTYHSLDDSGSPISVSPAIFRAQARWLAAGALRVVRLEELLALPDDADAVALTFDDGFANFAEVAAPLLLELGLPATLFVVTDRAGSTNAWRGRSAAGIPTLPLLGWDALARLAEAGIALGGHTRTHPSLPGLPDDAMEDEVAGSAARIRAETGRTPFAFAYPYGDASPEAAAAVARSYGCGCTTELRPLGPADDRRLLPRLDMYYLREPGRLEAWGTPGFRRRLWLRAGARRVRRMLAAPVGAG